MSDHDVMTYREIATHMTKNGHKMNHATARGILLRALRKLARHVLDELPDRDPNVSPDDLVGDETFHIVVADVVATHGTGVRSRVAGDVGGHKYR